MADLVHFRLRRRRLDGQSQTREHPQRMAATLGQARGEIERRPHLRLRHPEGSEVELRRHDADDCVAFTVEQDLLADDLRLRPEAPLPQGVSEHDHAIFARPEVARVKCASAQGNDTEQRKHVFTEMLADDLLRRVAASETRAP